MTKDLKIEQFKQQWKEHQKIAKNCFFGMLGSFLLILFLLNLSYFKFILTPQMVPFLENFSLLIIGLPILVMVALKWVARSNGSKRFKPLYCPECDKPMVNDKMSDGVSMKNMYFPKKPWQCTACNTDIGALNLVE